jgi:peroxiredoxin Q/BCP
VVSAAGPPNSMLANLRLVTAFVPPCAVRRAQHKPLHSHLKGEYAMTRLCASVFSIALAAMVGLSPALGEDAKVDLKKGDKAPQFECTDDAGKVWKSADHYGKKIVVIFFYPAAMTGGCTKQSCAFRDDQSKLAEKGVEVIGVSGDEVAGLKLFKTAHKLNFPLLADTEGAVAKKFGVPLGKGGEIKREVDGIEHILKRGVTAQRWTFVIDREGRIAMKNTKVVADKDSQAILKFVEGLAAEK